MANISDKTNLTQHGEVLPTVDWISQINAGGKTYDIATHHNIIFKDGSADTTGVKWNGLTDLEVVIPSITDIVQTPIEFAGTVGADGEPVWNSTHGDGPKNGYLVFVTEDCTFGGKACEAGDMAIYNDGKWNVVSGENQVSIVGSTQSDIDASNRTTVAIGAAKDVLVVEGKALSLTLDYVDFNTNHVEKTYGDTIGVDFKNITVGDDYLKLTQAAGEKVTVGEKVTFNRATALKDGKVTLTDAEGLVNGVTFGTFSAGEFPTLRSNAEKTFTVDGGSVVKGTGSDFVDSVSINDVTFETADEKDTNKIVMLTTLTAGKGTEFFSGIHKTTEGETADFTIKGFAVPTEGMTTKFVEGLEGDLTPVTSITAGDFKLVDGTALATGFGTAVAGKAGEVLSNVTVTPVKGANVLNSASVKDHVLSFGNVDVMSDVTVNYESKSLNKTGFQYTAPQATKTAFVTSGFTNVSDVDYTFGRTQETTYSADSASWKLNTPALTVTKGAYTFSDSGMKATVPAETFVVGQTAGTLPSLTEGTVNKVTVTGFVSTELTFAEQAVQAVKTTEITLPGAYTLGKGTEGDYDVLVGKAGAVAAKEASVNLKGYLMDVNVVTTKQA